MAASTSHGRNGLAAAVVLLGLVSPDAVSVSESACPSELRWLARHQQPDGSWGDPESPPADRVRLTGMALLNFLGAGYTHLSRDTYDGITFGHVLKNGIRHLMSLQSPEGRLTPGDLDVEPHAWAALALCEAFSLIESQLFKENAARSVAWLGKVQRPDGGWGREAGMDARVTALAAAVVFSAERGGLPVSGDLSRKASAALKRLVRSDTPSGTCAAAVAVAQIRKHPKSDPALRTRIDAIARDLRTPADAEPLHRFWGLLALFQFDGPAGPRYRSCCHDVKDTLVRSQIRVEGSDHFGSWSPPEMEASPVAPTKSVPPELRQCAEALIEELADEEWAVRKRATAGLLRLGPDVLPMLRDAADHPDPEVAVRATHVARKLSNDRTEINRRIETTCLNGLTLEVYYRYENVFGMPR